METNETNYDEMSFSELRRECGARSLPANGSKKELIERLTGATPREDEEEVKEETEETDETPKKKPKVTDKEVEREHRNDIQKMEAHLAKQPLIRMMIPLEQGVSPEDAEKIPFTVNINGCRKEYARGRYIDVPQQIADMITDRLQSEGSLGQDIRISSDPKKVEALS